MHSYAREKGQIPFRGHTVGFVDALSHAVPIPLGINETLDRNNTPSAGYATLNYDGTTGMTAV